MMYAGPGGNRGEFMAWDLSPGKRKSGAFPSASRSGPVRWLPAGDVAFYGTMDGWVKAVNAQDR